MASPKYQLYEFCESKSPGRTYLPSALMIHAFAGYGACPLRETLAIRFPWITTSESRIGVPPLPSISVPPSITRAGTCCDRAEGNSTAKSPATRNRTKQTEELWVNFRTASSKVIEC